MSLSSENTRVLNELIEYEPGLRKGQLKGGNILLGDILNRVELQVFSDLTRGSAASVPAGTVISNSDDGFGLNISDGTTDWRDALGNPT